MILIGKFRGRRSEEFRQLVPRQPWSEAGAEVRVNFEAVMLDVTRERESRLWIHVTTRACRGQQACTVRHGNIQGLQIRI